MRLVIFIVLLTNIFTEISYSQVPLMYSVDTLSMQKCFRRIISENTSKYIAYEDRVFIDEFELSSSDFKEVIKLNNENVSDEEIEIASSILNKYKPIRIELIPDIYEGKYHDPHSFFEVRINDDVFNFFVRQPQYRIDIKSLKTGILIKDKKISASENFRDLNISIKCFKDDVFVKEISTNRRVARANIQKIVRTENVNIILIELTNRYNDKLSMKFFIE